jgi:hypothetical protein
MKLSNGKYLQLSRHRRAAADFVLINLEYPHVYRELRKTRLQDLSDKPLKLELEVVSYQDRPRVDGLV